MLPNLFQVSFSYRSTRSEGDGDTRRVREMVNQVTPDVSEGDGESGDTRRVREMVIQVTADV